MYTLNALEKLFISIEKVRLGKEHRQVVGYSGCIK